MKRDEFLKQLEYLLQDIPEEEKRDAIDYYRDYLEEAGPEREEEVLQGFGSPERIAAMIRADFADGAENAQNAGEFTDQGFTDQRFHSSAYPAVPEQGKGRSGENSSNGEKNRPGDGERTFARSHGEYQKGNYARRRNPGSGRRDGSAENSGSSYGGAGYGGPVNGDPEGGLGNSGSENYRGQGAASGGSTDSRWWKYLLIGLGILIIGPFALAAAFGLAGGVLGLITTLAGCFLALAILTLAALIGGVLMILFGVVHLLANFWVGLMFLGLGLVAIGVGCLLFFCSWLFYGSFLPWAVKSIFGLFKKTTGNGENRGKGQPG